MGQVMEVCLVTWFCNQLIAKPDNETATVPWPGPYTVDIMNMIENSLKKQGQYLFAGNLL